MICRTATARGKAEQADEAAKQARHDAEIAKLVARQFAPEFHLPGLLFCYLLCSLLKICSLYLKQIFISENNNNSKISSLLKIYLNLSLHYIRIIFINETLSILLN